MSEASNTASDPLGTASEPLGTVYWEGEPARERMVRRWCLICRPEGGSINDVQIISRVGVAHESAGYGVTDCGRDATGENWWWAL
jgi:hypothetical protein